MIYGLHVAWHDPIYIVAVTLIGGFLYTVIAYMVYFLLQDYDKGVGADTTIAAILWPVVGTFWLLRQGGKLMLHTPRTIASLIYDAIKERE